ncbi:hypothetical protein I317_06721 [Kwoniella heveanensis CBS 569]|uniref:histidine kinase n=1 Tax=Kwoniella heveanensis BCC8398 TaxID=1296120 RepID=A0A1B9GLX2_9TREE|nr:hypothetical protein I316_06379 [Kwoniella heveanensis BCC8398]OCF39503.1 hypothetical protein I317_06721 [Kwoniella heveanensis CBS 569]
MSPLPVVELLSSSSATSEIEHHQDLLQWSKFLSNYAKGDWAPGLTPAQPPPMKDASLFEEPQNRVSPDPTATSSSSETPSADNVYFSTRITPKLAKKVHDYCLDNDYLPPPRSPQEKLRVSIIKEYDLLGPLQGGNIQSAVDLTGAFFPETICTFTLFNDAIQTFYAVTGPQALLDRYALKNHMYVAPETSLCGHSVLLDGQILHVPQLAEDWRFRSNPYTRAGLVSYIGSPVSLELDPLNTSPNARDVPQRVGIGALNILFVGEPLMTMSSTQTMVVRNVTTMLETQLRATWEGHIRTREAKVRRVITDLIEEAFVGDYNEPERRRCKGELNARVQSENDTANVFAELAQSAADKLLALSPEVEAVVFLDVRGLTPKAQSLGTRPQYELNPLSPHPVSAFAMSPRETSSWTRLPSPAALVDFFNRQNCLFEFGQGSGESGLEQELPESTKSHLAMPFFTLDQPLFVVIAISRSPLISRGSIHMTRSLGSIILAKAVQSRVLEADAAKTAFLSSISHELRTPMHSIMSGLNLIKQSIDAQQWDDTNSLLSLVETSGQSLYRILNDILDFGKAHTENDTVSRSVQADLVTLVKTAAHMCLTQSEALDFQARLLLEYEKRDWQVIIDDARYQRIVINALSNAMKFCKTGTIALSLSTTPDSQQLITRITDTGIGIDEKMLRRVLEPFTKQDPHSPGAGLGLYITQNLIKRMGGTFAIESKLGEGTTFEAIIPIHFQTTTTHVDRSVLVRQDLHAVDPSPVRTRAALLGHDAARDGSISSTRRAPITPDAKTMIVKAAKPVALKSTSDPSARKSSAKSDKSPLRVMVVDDNRICLRVLATALKKGPTPVLCKEAIDGQQAVDAFADFRPDLVLTDVSMPVMDGVTAAGKMRGISEEMGLPPCKIYALTGLGSSDPRLKSIGMAGSAALNGWLVKGQDDLKVIHGIVSQVNEEVRSAGVTEMTKQSDLLHVADSLLFS